MSDRQQEHTEYLRPRPPTTPAAYSPPVIVRLGTLAELTRGGNTGFDDVLGDSGDQGSA